MKLASGTLQLAREQEMHHNPYVTQHTSCAEDTFEQSVGGHTHLTVGTVLPFEGRVELIHRNHQRAWVLFLDLQVSCLFREMENMWIISVIFSGFNSKINSKMIFLIIIIIYNQYFFAILLPD